MIVVEAPAVAPTPAPITPPSPEEADAVKLVAGVVGARYKGIKFLGKGGMGVVCEANDTTSGRLVALKVMWPQLASDRDQVARFRREALALKACAHPHIVELFSEPPEDAQRQLFLVMERLHGIPLRDWLDKHKKIENFATALRLAWQLSDALAHVHAKGWLHRDLKPLNIFLSGATLELASIETAEAKLLDFGLVKSKDDSEALTRVGVAPGTPRFMPAEMFYSGTFLPDERADVFAMGVTLYQMLTGAYPHPRVDRVAPAELTASREELRKGGHTPIDVNRVDDLQSRHGRAFAQGDVIVTPLDANLVVAWMQMYIDATPIELHAPDLPTDVARLINGSLACDREKREPRTMAAFRDAIPAQAVSLNRLMAEVKRRAEAERDLLGVEQGLKKALAEYAKSRDELARERAEHRRSTHGLEERLRRTAQWRVAAPFVALCVGVALGVVATPRRVVRAPSVVAQVLPAAPVPQATSSPAPETVAAPLSNAAHDAGAGPVPTAPSNSTGASHPPRIKIRPLRMRP